MKRLAIGTGLVAATTAVLYEYQSPGALQYQRLDRYLVHYIAATAIFAVLVMLTTRPTWRYRAVGLLFILFGVAVLSTLSAYLSHVGFSGTPPPPSDFRQNIDPGTREFLVDLYRASLAVGCTLTNIGLIRYLLDRRNGFVGSDEWEPGDPERRQGYRREADRQMVARLEQYEQGGGVK